MAYNPAIRYLPPVNAAGAEYPSMTSANTGGWTAVKNDAYNVQNTGSINLLTQFPDTEWCTDSGYTDCLRNGNYVLPGTVNGKNLTVVYNHASGYRVGVGDHVRRGEIVGYVGDTGWSTGCHLHFTVLVNGTAVDPENWL